MKRLIPYGTAFAILFLDHSCYSFVLINCVSTDFQLSSWLNYTSMQLSALVMLVTRRSSTCSMEKVALFTGLITHLLMDQMKIAIGSLMQPEYLSTLRSWTLKTVVLALMWKSLMDQVTCTIH